MAPLTPPTRPDGRPLVIAHRGAAADAPENTIASFELAIEQGADGLGLDVHLSRDGHPVVIRDVTIERTTNAAGPVRQHTVRELKRLDAGGWRGRRFRGQQLQTLQEVLERFRDRARFWIELPGGSEIYPEIEERVLSTLEVYDVVDQTLLQSSDLGALTELRRLSREVRLGAVVRPPLELPLPYPGPLLQALCPSLDALTEDEAARIRSAGLECYPWTLNEPTELGRLLRWRIDGFFTDRPGSVRAELDRCDWRDGRDTSDAAIG